MIDVITIGFGVPHLPHPPHCFAEARRVLRPGGRIAFSVWQAPPASQAFGFVFAAVAAHGDPSVSLPPAPGAHDYADPDVAGPALREAGFGDVKLETVDSHWMVDDPCAPYDYFIEGTVRGSALLRPQPETNRKAIREFVGKQVIKACGETAPWRVAIPAAIVFVLYLIFEPMLVEALVASYLPHDIAADPGAVGVSMNRESWPHGETGPAIPHGAIFSR